MPVSVSAIVEVQLSVGVWTDITEDVLGMPGLRIKYGVQGNGPLDCVAGTGECSFDLRNDAENSGGVAGYYSPIHVNKRTGWTFGIPIRVRFTHGTTRDKFRGKVAVIDPDPGTNGPRRVHVVAYDGMHDLAEADVRAVAIQIGQSEDVLVEEILDSLDVDAQPVARDIDTGVDTFPYAFHDVGAGAKALTMIQRVAENSFAFAAMKGDGTFIFRSRNTRATGASAYTFTTMRGLQAPSSLEQVYNIVRVTIHPKTVDAAATTVLYAATGTPPSIAPGASLVVWADYRDPANTATLIGGTAVVNPLVAATDYAGNSQADGLGSNLTGSLSVTIEPFASTARITVTNNHATSTIYLVNGSGVAFLQVRGKGVYDRGPQTYEKASTAAYGMKTLPIDLDYQSNASIAQSYADYVHAQYSSLSSRVDALTIVGNVSGDFMDEALDREPCDVITVTESMTGLSLVAAVIQSVELEYIKGGILTATWGLAPAAPFQAWVLGVAGRTELGETTRLGF